MNEITFEQTPMATAGTLAFALGAAIAAGHATWPVQEFPAYVVEQTGPSYSPVSERALVSNLNSPYIDFANQIASIYASLNLRQENLGRAFEAAIFDDLDSLYES